MADQAGGGDELRWSGVVLMKGHPRHPMLHHHGLGDLVIAAGRVTLTDASGEALAAAPGEQVTCGSSKVLEEYGSILFVDFGAQEEDRESQWAVDFAPAYAGQDYVHPDGSPSAGALLEYQERLSVEEIEDGIKGRQQFADAVVGLGGRREDESTLWERLLAHWLV